MLKTTWKFKKDSAYFTNHTSYISDKFLVDNLKIKKEDLYEAEDVIDNRVGLINYQDQDGLKYQVEPLFFNES